MGNRFDTGCSKKAVIGVLYTAFNGQFAEQEVDVLMLKDLLDIKLLSTVELQMLITCYCKAIGRDPNTFQLKDDRSSVNEKKYIDAGEISQVDVKTLNENAELPKKALNLSAPGNGAAISEKCNLLSPSMNGPKVKLVKKPIQKASALAGGRAVSSTPPSVRKTRSPGPNSKIDGGSRDTIRSNRN